MDDEHDFCRDHWHCDPNFTGHDCTGPDRTKPCPGCAHEPKRFQDGQRVILKAVTKAEGYQEDIGEERGTVLGGDVPGKKDWPTMYTVEVDPEFTLSDCSDDGLRELSEDQMEPEPEPRIKGITPGTCSDPDCPCS